MSHYESYLLSTTTAVGSPCGTGSEPGSEVALSVLTGSEFSTDDFDWSAGGTDDSSSQTGSGSAD